MGTHFVCHLFAVRSTATFHSAEVFNGFQVGTHVVCHLFAAGFTASVTADRTLGTLEESSPTKLRAITANNYLLFFMISLILQYVQTHRQGIFIPCKSCFVHRAYQQTTDSEMKACFVTQDIDLSSQIITTELSPQDNQNSNSISPTSDRFLLETS